MANYRHIIPFIREWEGGLSRDPADPAAAYPAPCLYNGEMGWHTNKGVTYQTFKENASSLGYAATCANFFSMPDDIWHLIYKKLFWDPWQLDKYRSQAIADIILDWSYNSGSGTSYREIREYLARAFKMDLPASFNQENAELIRKKFNALSWVSEQRVRKDLLQLRSDFYKSLNRPDYLTGWLNRLEDLTLFTLASLRKSLMIKFVISGLTAAAVTAGALVFINSRKGRS